MSTTGTELHSFDRAQKSFSFDLPPPDPGEQEIEVDLADLEGFDLEYSDAERTLKQGGVDPYAPGEAASAPKDETPEEVDPNDVLAEFPADPEEPFELRVPQTILSRAALLQATLPRETLMPSSSSIPPPMTMEAPRVEAPREARVPEGRLGWLVAPMIGACVGLAVAAVLSYHLAPAGMAPAALSAGRHLKAHATKVLVEPVAMLEAQVPTVTVDSLPRAR